MTETLPPQAMLLQAAEHKQRGAADPAVSAWVRANAGTGKTHVLVQRILRLLLSGAEPRSILCLTFTKNAAAEMEARVLGRLAEWATADDASLNKHLSKLLDRAPDENELIIGRCLFATVIDAPGGLAIMTIHGFCERVLRRYSLEANVPPGFIVLTEEDARDALHEATASAFAAAAEGPLGDALTTIVAHAAEGEFARVLQAMLCERSSLAQLFSLTTTADPVSEIAARLRRIFGVGASETGDALRAKAVELLDAQTLKQIISVLSAGTKSDLECLERFQAIARASESEARRAALKAAFSTKDGKPRKSLMTAAVRKSAGSLHDLLVSTQARFLEIDEKLCGLKVIEATTALLSLTATIFEGYAAEKRSRTALDFDDLIEKTLVLLSRQDAAEWVLYELDARIDHILVDEAQDTSPEQWAILEKLTSDFFAGQGARDCVPTLFAVGDEKQSIYGFQGARPELLGHYGKLYEKRVREAGFDWRSVDLDLSFRTLASVLNAVDFVSSAMPSFRQTQLVAHLAYRRDEGGLVEIWEPERGEAEEKGIVWEPDSESKPAPKPAEALAERIAEQIQFWLVTGEGLASKGRSIAPGDILILLRKRQPMAKLLQASLKRRGIPVAGADRVALLDELAVMDLLALADVVLQPEDDLALAALLKSPLLGLSEDDLFELAYERPRSLWHALADAAEPRRAEAAAKLASWRRLASHCGPFDFYAHILEAEGGRKAFAARLGAECFDGLDEFLNLAESFSERGAGGLLEFVAFVRESASDVKRETEQAAREVRIMTVHGAKGLEADIVILADTCGNRSASPTPVFFVGDDEGTVRVPVWAIKGSSALKPIANVKEALKDDEQRELGRLLYVAMTRARDRLYVAGFHNGSLPEGCWHQTIQSSLGERLYQDADFQGRTVWRTMPQSEFRPLQIPAESASPAPLPAWIDLPATKESGLAIQSPSRLLAWKGGGNAAPERLACRARNIAQARGTLIHRLLEVLPAMPAANRASVAQSIASSFSSILSREEIREAISGVAELLSSGLLLEHDGPSLAEAGLAVTVDIGSGKMSVIAGQADRVLIGGTGVTVIDYKTGAQSSGAEANRAHLAQLGAYRLALRNLYPEKPIHAVLLDPASMRMMKADPEELDILLEQLNAHIS